jgi:hypothetical protein
MSKVPQGVCQTQSRYSISDDDQDCVDDLDQGRSPGSDEPASPDLGHRRVDKRSRQLLKSMKYVDVFHLFQPLLECKASELGCKDGSRGVLKCLATVALPTPLTNKSAIKQRTFLMRKFGSMSFYALAMLLIVRADGPPRVVSGEARDALVHFRARLLQEEQRQSSISPGSSYVSL